MNTFIAMLRDESGASAAEYALILAIIGSGLAVAAMFLGAKIGNALETRGNQIEDCATDPTLCGS